MSNIKTSLEQTTITQVQSQLNKANVALNTWYPGESGNRQPVHTVYGGANLFKSTLAGKLGTLALGTLDTYAKNYSVFAKAVQLKGHEQIPSNEEEIVLLSDFIKKDPIQAKKNNPGAWLAYTVYNRVLEKLKSEPIEDFRIDFEDGYGNRPNEEEDAHAVQAAEQVAEGMKNNTLPPFIGIRIKPLTEELKNRSIRTLDIFLTALAGFTNSKLPENFVVTIPKVTIPEQVEALANLFDAIEAKTGFAKGSLKMEVMIETTQAIINNQGEYAIPLFVKAGRGKIRGAHFGTYDYTASCNITATYQSVTHPVCDFARNVMQITLANTGIMISDGATTIMPIGPHKAAKEGPALSSEQVDENTKVVHSAWKLAFDNINNSPPFRILSRLGSKPRSITNSLCCYVCFLLRELRRYICSINGFLKTSRSSNLSRA